MAKSNNNYSKDQYSHKFARANYAKKSPKNLYAQVIKFITTGNRNETFSIEYVSKSLNVLHKHVHCVFMQLMRDGKIRISRYEAQNGVKKHQMPVAWPAYYRRYTESRIANQYYLTDKL